MANREIGKRFAGYFKVTQASGAVNTIPVNFWKNVRAMIKFLNNRVAYGLDVYGNATAGNIVVSAGAVIQNRVYRVATASQETSFSWTGSANGKTVVYVPFATNGAVTVAATLEAALPSTATVLAYLNTSRNTLATIGGSSVSIDNSVRPSLWENRKPFII